MALVTIKNFGLALNIVGSTIRNRISRGSLICDKNKLMNTEHPKNYAYLLEINGGDQSVFDKYISNTAKTRVNSKKVVLEKPSKIKASVRVAPSQNTKQKIVVEKEVEVKLSAQERREQQEQKKHRDSLLQMEIRRKEAELSLVERNAELKQMELEKKAGNTLPLDMIENVMTINYKAVFKSIHSQIKNIAMVMVQQLGGSKEDLNNIMIELEQILDTTVKDSKKKSDVDIEKLIEEYSEIRSRGERK